MIRVLPIGETRDCLMMFLTKENRLCPVSCEQYGWRVSNVFYATMARSDMMVHTPGTGKR